MKTMSHVALIVTLFASLPSAYAGPQALTGGQAFLAASLAALSTPKMKNAPIQVNGSVRHASGVQEDSGARAIVAIPDEGAGKLDFSKLTDTAAPLCRLWMKSCALKLDDKAKTNLTQKEVVAESDKHSVTVWLLGVRMSAKGRPELLLCSNQKEPVLVLPLTGLKDTGNMEPDVPVQVSVQPLGEGAQVVLLLRGTHQVKLALE